MVESRESGDSIDEPVDNSAAGSSDLDGVSESSTVRATEIPNSGGKVAVQFDNWLEYGGNCPGCWGNSTEGNFVLNANGKGFWTLLNKHGDGSWGQTDIVVTNAVA